MRIAAIVCNLIFLGFVGWALMDQYPHPEEEGFLLFVFMMAGTPILTLLVLFVDRAGYRRRMIPLVR